MAATIDIEFEAGVYTALTRRHRGYWAGDFSQLPLADDRSEIWRVEPRSAPRCGASP